MAREGQSVRFLGQRPAQNEVTVAMHQDANHTAKWYTSIALINRVSKSKKLVRYARWCGDFCSRRSEVHCRVGESFEFAPQIEPMV